MKKIHLLLLSVLSGVLLTLGWPVNGFPLFLFIAFIPLFYLEDQIFRERQMKKRFGRFSVFFYTYPAFFIWNISTTYWIYNSTVIGAALAFILNSLFMAIIFSLFHASRMAFKGRLAGYISLIAFWISFEYIHQQWELSWPWLNLGNGFGSYPKWVQWYEFTGIFGGTFWILTTSIALFYLMKSLKSIRSIKLFQLIGLLLIIIWITCPILISEAIYNRYEEKNDPVHVVIVQPNLDPYSEQYELTPFQVMERVFALAEQKVDSLTQFVVCPESTIQERPMYEGEITLSESYKLLTGYLINHPGLHFVIGASTYKIFDDDEPLSSTARKFPDAERYYDAYNTAMMVDPEGKIQLYHKSKLTPGVEIMPYSRYLGFLENMAIDLGGTVGSLGTDNERTPFTIPDPDLKVAPVICYESVYGEFCNGYIRNGANMIFVITNDGWWGNTAGYKQHFTFSVLRAIETRRSVARSANTGISAFINQKGDIMQPTEYWVQDVIQQEINASDRITFYVKYGDYIARISLFLSALLLLITLSTNFLRKRKSLRV